MGTFFVVVYRKYKLWWFGAEASHGEYVELTIAFEACVKIAMSFYSQVFHQKD